MARNQLSEIKVVPNPYIAHAIWEIKEGIRKIQFTHLPDVCTIRIYTLAGDLVKTIQHDNLTGTEDWDMLSENQQGIVAGVYFYHVQSKYGEKIGKFAVIK
ncbi:MAG: T9SS type A sorting domain-containing protein [Candidatus Zixiibacteriota bacterium]